MRIANSSAYTPNSNLVSIQQAVTRLGTIEISNIAFLTFINSKIFKARGDEKHIEVIWQHALATALWAKEVARAMRSEVMLKLLFYGAYCTVLADPLFYKQSRRPNL
jgi:HD-like signal output (HDOD) protein